MTVSVGPELEAKFLVYSKLEPLLPICAAFGAEQWLF